VEILAPWVYSTGDKVLGFLVPGYALLRGGRPTYGGALVAAYGLLALVFAIGMGHPAGNLAYGLMISIHASSGIFLAFRLWARDDLLERLGIAVGVLLATILLIYLPLSRVVLPRFVLPVNYNGKVVIVKVGGNPARLKRGDWVAYRTAPFSGSGYRVESGIGLEQIQAMAKDRVKFAEDHYEVDGVARARPGFLPLEGEWMVPEDCWMIWPNLATRRGDAGRVDLTGALQQLSIVSMDQYIGKPFTRWFGRKQMPL
jgi:hypothetical protein